MTTWAPWRLRPLVRDLVAGNSTPDEVARDSARRIAATDPSIHAWVTHRTDGPPAGSRGRRGVLGGVPLGVKDIIDVAGLPTRCGSELRADTAAVGRDAAIVRAWRAAGAFPVGKTVTTEFAYFDPGPTRNPVDTGRTPGGSSSGSAAAVAAGHVPLALGSQTAGSVTRPGAYCGIASLVMTHGRWPTDGVTGLSPSLDAHGVFTATVSDLALAWSALTGAADAGVARHSPSPRLLVWTAETLGVVSDPMGAALADTAEALRLAGATVDVMRLDPLIAEATEAHRLVMAYEAARERAEEMRDLSRLSEPFADLLRSGAALPEKDYRSARRAVSTAAQRVARTMTGYDGVLGPAAPGSAPAGLHRTGDPILSRAWQALGLPSVGVPGLRDAHGLPLGLQVVGRHGGELDALRAAIWVEEELTRSGLTMTATPTPTPAGPR